MAEEEGAQILRDPVEAKQILIDPNFSLYSDPMFKREGGKKVGFIDLLRSRHFKAEPNAFTSKEISLHFPRGFEFFQLSCELCPAP